MSVILETTFDAPIEAGESAEEFPPQEADAVDQETDASDEIEADEQIDDPSLLDALRDLKSWRALPQNQRTLLALFLAIAVHGMLIGICLMLAVKLHVFAPRLEIAGGRSGSEGDLVQTADPADSPDNSQSIPGPAVPMPAAQKRSLDEPPESIGAPEPLSDSSRQTRIDLSADPADPLIFGIQSDSTGTTPRWHRATAPSTNEHPAAAPRAVAPASSPLASSANAAPAAPVHHVYVSPHGAGRGGGGNEGVDYDERGIPIPPYPPESYRRHEEGTVDLQVLVRSDGSVGGAKIARSSGFPRLDQAALSAIGAAHFTPGTCDGAAIAMQVVVPFRFTLQE